MSRAAAALLRWRERWGGLSHADRLQGAGATVLVLAVFAVFAYGAATRDPSSEEGAGALRGGTTLPSADGRGAPIPGRDDARRSAVPAAGAGALGPAGAAGAAGARRGQVAGDGSEGVAGGPGSPGSDARPSPGAPGGAAAGGPVLVAVAHPVGGADAELATALGTAHQRGDAEGQARAVASWINGHGGVGGRGLELRFAPYDPATGGSLGEAFAGACARAGAGPEQPMAIVGVLEDAAAQRDCAAGHGIPLIADGPGGADSELLAAGSLYAPGGMALDRMARAQVAALVRERAIERGTRVGIVRLSGGSFARASEQALRPALDRAGARVAGEYAVPRPRRAADAGDLLSAVATAALRLRAAGADAVVVLDDALISAPLMRAADAIGYRPRYGLNTTMAPAALIGRVPAAQLRGAVGAGYAPLLDVGEREEPGATPARRQCEEIYRAGDVPLGGRTAAGRYAAMALCDELLLLRDALAGGGEPTAAGLRSAIERLGTRRSSAVALAARMDDGRRDGAATVRTLRFDGRCDCLRYEGSEEEAR